MDNEINVQRLYEHLEPNEFAFLCDLLGNHVDLLKPGRVCFYCGEPTSFKHCFANCDKLQEKVDLEVLLTDSDAIKTEFEKLRRIYDQTVLESLQADCSGKN